MIHEIKGFLNKQDLENVNKMKDLMIKFDGKMSAGKFAASVKSSNTFHVPVISDHSKIDGKSDSKMSTDLANLAFNAKNQKRIAQEVTGSEFATLDCRIIEYEKSEDYGWHLDFTTHKKSLQNLKTNKISFVIFLSNPSEYEGGELEIELETEMKSYKCNKGTILLYPSDRLHRVRKISAGKRTVIIGWIYCLYQKPYNRYVICKSTKALHDLFDYIHHNKGKKKDLESAFNAFMLLNAQYKKLSLTNH